MVQDDLQNMMYQNDAWMAYKSLNQRFADVIVENYQEGDISKYAMIVLSLILNTHVFYSQVWINDYHLMLLPGLVREKLPHAVIGFFLHIPFPSSELFRCLPSKSPPPPSFPIG